MIHRLEWRLEWRHHRPPPPWFKGSLDAGCVGSDRLFVESLANEQPMFISLKAVDSNEHVDTPSPRETNAGNIPAATSGPTINIHVDGSQKHYKGTTVVGSDNKVANTKTQDSHDQSSTALRSQTAKSSTRKDETEEEFGVFEAADNGKPSCDT
ncbi:hypothetical protein BaRGS_00033189 [Batillaria attramentaria]|uniref:Uncharacterized protein n=1 Tax=Batillaria attramentaria TaxID=370345 RepID=A0ABD0JL31_9CAEN